ncbi:hypothetical protein ACX0G7_06860 [Flavitalea antarctica]
MRKTVICLLYLFLNLPVLLAQNLKIVYAAPVGISQLTYGNVKLININSALGRGFSAEVVKRIQKGGKPIFEWSHLQRQSWNDEKKELTSIFTWGSVVVQYGQVKDTLNAKFTILNYSSDTLCGLSFCPLSLNVGKRPLNFKPSYPYYSNNINTPAAISAQLGNFDIVIENPERSKKVYMGLLEENNTNGALYRIWHGNIPFNGMTEFNPEAELRLAPGKTFTYTMAVKFVKPNLSLNTVASKAFQNYRVNQPSSLTWEDRRPIAELFLGSYSGLRKEKNPRNWVIYNAEEVDIISKNGSQQFKLNTLKYARNSLVYLKNINAQGMIVWDIEGQEFPHPLTYVGSPELISRLAPEMNAVADDFFAIFKKEGYKTGICIRPDSIVFKGNRIEHIPVANPAITLINKINYAKKRWGCTIFYVDSNLDPLSRLMNAEVFRLVHEAIPDVLLIPEHENIQYFNYSAPYTDLKTEQSLLVEKAIKDVNPDAFKVITVSEGLKGTSAQNLKQLTQSVEEGNILLFRGWYPDEPTHSLIKKAWEVGSKARK